MKGFRLNYAGNDLRKKVNLIDLSILTKMSVLNSKFNFEYNSIKAYSKHLLLKYLFKKIHKVKKSVIKPKHQKQ
ncbi:hypothetical protein AVL50_03315 [Flammeovirga sp. SJP92]|nr:hypothetical protein AVL50_03315 [Flammeovirga sp. SJP92]